jgi:hypothetical protein
MRSREIKIIIDHSSPQQSASTIHLRVPTQLPFSRFCVLPAERFLVPALYCDLFLYPSSRKATTFRCNMHIALVAPLHEHIPPLRYGGVERIVSFLAEELVRLGHQVDLYACGGSMTDCQIGRVLAAVLSRGWHRFPQRRGQRAIWPAAAESILRPGQL